MNPPNNDAGRPGRGDHADNNNFSDESIPCEQFRVKGKLPSRVFFYAEQNGAIAGAVARFETGEIGPDKEFRQYRSETGRFCAGLNGHALPLYRLPELARNPEALVLWVEGERCADALAGLGFIATTTAGGAKGFAAWLRKSPQGLAQLAGREVVILADNDAPGAAYAHDVAKALNANECRVRIVDPLPWANLGDGADVADWIKRGNGVDALREVIAVAPLSASTKPQVSDDDLQLPAEHPVLQPEALYGIAGEFVTACRPYCEAHDAGLLFSLLTLAGCCCGADLKSPVVYVGADKHHARLFTSLVGPTSRGRKGTAWGPVRMLQEIMGDSDDAFEATPQTDFAALGLDPDSEAVQRRPGSPHVHDGGLSSGEGVIFRIRDEREVGKKKAKRGEEPETEIDPGETDKRLLIYQAEFGGVLRMNSRDGNTLADTLRTGWDGTTKLSPLTKNNRICATRPHVCILANVTSEELRTLLDACAFFGGFVNRFLWVAVRRARLIPIPDALPIESLRPIAQRVRRAVLSARGRVFKLSEDAKASWVATYRELENRTLAGLTAKATERASPYVLRLALIYAILDEAPEIRLPHLTAAVATWRYAQDSASYIFGGLADALNADAHCLLQAAKDAGGNFPLSEAYGVFQGHITKQRLESALRQLADNCLAEVSEEPTAGRPRRILRVL